MGVKTSAVLKYLTEVEGGGAVALAPTSQPSSTLLLVLTDLTATARLGTVDSERHILHTLSSMDLPLGFWHSSFRDNCCL